MNRLHVHVYRVVAMAEVDMDVDLPQGTREALEGVLAQARAGRLVFERADCTYIAMPFQGESGVAEA